MPPLLEVKDLTVEIRDAVVLSHISLTVSQGEVVAVIGPNGAGKTTLLRAIMGIVPYRGHITWHQVVPIGYVPQRFTFDRSYPLTVEELFLLRSAPAKFWMPSKMEKDGVKRALSHTGVEDMAGRRLGELSAGQLQRVFISLALHNNPGLLLFDEPTASIDIGAEMSIYNLLHEIATELKLTMILVSHDLSVVYDYAAQVVCLNRRIECVGPPRKILTPKQLDHLYGGNTAFYGHEHGEGRLHA